MIIVYYLIVGFDPFSVSRSLGFWFAVADYRQFGQIGFGQILQAWSEIYWVPLPVVSPDWAVASCLDPMVKDLGSVCSCRLGPVVRRIGLFW